MSGTKCYRDTNGWKGVTKMINKVGYMFIVAVLFPLSLYGQPKFETQVHYSMTAGDLGEITGGGIGNVLIGLSVPINDNINTILKVGYNDYGGIEGYGLLQGLEFKASGIPFIGGIRVYDANQRLFFEAGLGAEVKRGHLSFGSDTAEETQTAFLGSAGAGFFFWRGIGFTGSFNISQNSWQYGNIGLVFRFGG